MGTKTNDESALRKVVKATLAGVLAVGVALPISTLPPMDTLTDTTSVAYADTLHKKLVNGDFSAYGPFENGYNGYLNPLTGKGVSLVDSHEWQIPNFDPDVYGWRTTEPLTSWGGVDLGGGYMQTDCGSAAQLCASTPNRSIYQDIATVPNAIYHWQLDHNQSTFNGHQYGQMKVLIGNTGGQVEQTATRIKSNGVPLNKDGDTNAVGYSSTTITTPADPVNPDPGHGDTYEGWYYCPDGQTVTRFTFADLSGTSQDDDANNIDNVSFEISYPLSYDLRGGSSTDIYTDPTGNNYQGYHVEDTTATLSSAVPTRSGYTFLGWSATAVTDCKTADDVAAVTFIDSINMTEAKTVYAVYAENPTVTFKAGFDDNKTLSESTIPYASAATAPSVPSRVGFTFNGWDKSYDKITQDTVVTAQWYPITNLIVASHKGDGTITDEGTTKYGWDEDTTYTITPDKHNKIKDVLVDGVSVGAVTEYTFNDIEKSHTIQAIFEPIMLPVTFVDGITSGTLKTESVQEGSGATAPEVPEHEGYTFTGWDKTYDDIEQATTVTAIYDAITNDIIATADKGGAITDSGLKTYSWKEDGTYTITPDQHYKIKDVLVDGVSVGAVSEYTFNDVIADHEIEAQFEPIIWEVVFETGTGTTISTQPVMDGDDAVAPADPTREGYTFKGWDKTYDNITGNLVVTAQWEEITPEVDASHEGNGSISKEGTTEYEYSEDATYTIVPTPHNKIKDVLVDGVSVGAVSEYTFTDLQADHTIKAIFEPILWDVIFVDGQGNMLSEQSVVDGDNAAAPSNPTRDGYTFKGWDKTYDNITGNLVVTAQWDKNPEAATPVAAAQQAIANAVKTGDLTEILPALALLFTAISGAMIAWLRKKVVRS